MLIGKKAEGTMMDADNDAKQTTKTALLNTITNIISIITGIVIIPLITHVLSTEDMGIASTFFSTRNILAAIFTFAVYAYVNNAMLDYKYDKVSYIYTVTVFCLGSIICFFFLLLPFKAQVQKVLSLDEFLFYWLFVSSFFLAIYSIGYYYCIFNNKYIKVALIVMTAGTLSPLASLVLSFMFEDSKFIGRVLGSDFAYIAVTICVIIWLLIFRGKKFSIKYIKQTLKFSIPIIPHILSQMILTQCDLIMITYFDGSDKAGIYGMGHTVGYLALNVVTQIMAVWSPWVYRRLHDLNFNSVFHNSKLIILLGTYVSLGLLAIEPEIIHIFLPNEYLPCIYIVPPLVVAMYFQFIYMFLYDVEYYNKKAKWIAAASIGAAVINVILNWICIPFFGYLAACYTTVASYLVLLIANYFFCRKLDIRKIYDLRYILLLILLVILYAYYMLSFNHIIGIGWNYHYILYLEI